MIDKKDLGLVSKWLRHLTDVKDKYSDLIDALPKDAARAQKLCELNVIDQVRNVCESTIVQNAWKEQRSLAVHGWVYSLEDGLLKDLLEKPVTAIAESLALP